MTDTDIAVTLVRGINTSLAQQLSAEIEKLIGRGTLRAGVRLPSVRSMADSHGTSTHTVVEAYSYLVARGVVLSRRGSGFFVAEQGEPTIVAEVAKLRESLDPKRLGQELMSDAPSSVRLGGGPVSSDWVDYIELESAVRKISRGLLPRFGALGTTQGYAPLRETLARQISQRGIKATSSNILLTNGATQAIDLLIRLLVKPGQCVLIDDPGYFQTVWALKVQGAHIVGVPRNLDGPDVAAFERICAELKPAIFFTQSALQNPTGSLLSLSVAHDLLRVAEKYGVTIIEDDVSADLAPENATRLAMLDQLHRVIYVGSFSKTLTPSLRVGFLATKRSDFLEELVTLKLISCYASCEPNEAIVHSLLADGHYARHVRRLDRRLQERAIEAISRLEQEGFELDQAYLGGTFVWMKHKAFDDAMTLTNQASRMGMLLAPGCAFRPNLESSPYFRFSLPLCTSSALDMLSRAVAAAK
jgi:DNA-binding transcriptional MocR family regulator